MELQGVGILIGLKWNNLGTFDVVGYTYKNKGTLECAWIKSRIFMESIKQDGLNIVLRIATDMMREETQTRKVETNHNRFLGVFSSRKNFQVTSSKQERHG
ncbi:hypothetical protein PanWU01x14_069180 [Parasponia andersonii]|uniref:Uncharacterized protein n=1 Tax=Parasponia andersonii TaxID=3476 RepID=A0A2P5DFL0_PARAD|nr:hypothetical protein PanWU01x14_069180 [Parasponia andersonii]